ncbi:MAG: peptidylprolyl isomerase [Oscillospiraceae bacterium]|nr:peptidylprolyl isomerase [Oscillospiraceae bacterium]
MEEEIKTVETEEVKAEKKSGLSMKGLIALLLVICIAGSAVVGTVAGKKETAEPEEEAVITDPAELEEQINGTGEVAMKTMDFAAMYASFDPDEVVATVNGSDVTWKEYFYWYYSNASMLENYFMQMYVYTGAESTYTDELREGVTYLDYLKDSTDGYLVQAEGTLQFMAEHDVALSDEMNAEVDADIAAAIVEVCGEGATDADFEAYLAQNYLPLDYYRQVMTLGKYYEEASRKFFGENGSMLTEEEVQSWMEEKGYTIANHILFLNSDMETGEARSEETIKANCAKAEEIRAELMAIEDPAERTARFCELKQELCEDTGKVAYPNGYIFVEGEMVTEFYEGARALQEYEVSEPIESTYGYHVIMRLPLDTEWTMGTDENGMPITARAQAAEAKFNEMLSAYLDTIEVVYSEKLQAFDPMAFVK